MSEPNLICRLRLGPSHQPTGKTRHFFGSSEIPLPVELRIVQYDGDPGLYLFYCDPTGKEMTDTYHDSLEGAMSQADWEFNVKPEDWNFPSR